MPFANYKDFSDCVSKNQDKKSPEGYCAVIKRKVEGEMLESLKEKYSRKESFREAQRFKEEEEQPLQEAENEDTRQASIFLLNTNLQIYDSAVKAAKNKNINELKKLVLQTGVKVNLANIDWKSIIDDLKVESLSIKAGRLFMEFQRGKMNREDYNLKVKRLYEGLSDEEKKKQLEENEDEEVKKESDSDEFGEPKEIKPSELDVDAHEKTRPKDFQVKPESIKEADDMVSISRQDAKELKKLYDNAVAKGLSQFKFKGKDVLTSYAKYMLQYLKSKGMESYKSRIEKLQERFKERVFTEASNEQVVRAFLSGNNAKSGSMKTDGKKLFSYATVIAENRGTIILLNKKKYSVTTTTQQNLVRRLAPEYSKKIQEVEESVLN